MATKVITIHPPLEIDATGYGIQAIPWTDDRWEIICRLPDCLYFRNTQSVRARMMAHLNTEHPPTHTHNWVFVAGVGMAVCRDCGKSIYACHDCYDRMGNITLATHNIMAHGWSVRNRLEDYVIGMVCEPCIDKFGYERVESIPNAHTPTLTDGKPTPTLEDGNGMIWTCGDCGEQVFPPIPITHAGQTTTAICERESGCESYTTTAYAVSLDTARRNGWVDTPKIPDGWASITTRNGHPPS